MKRKCPNCGNECRLNEFVKHCRKCGYIFIELMNIMNRDEIEERTTTRRTGDGVDRLDG